MGRNVWKRIEMGGNGSKNVGMDPKWVGQTTYNDIIVLIQPMT